jgi:aconitate hydratase
MATANPFQAEATLKTKGGSFKIFRLRKLTEERIANIDVLPYSIRVLLESCLRNVDNFIVNEPDVVELANWSASAPKAIDSAASCCRISRGCRP